MGDVVGFKPKVSSSAEYGVRVTDIHEYRNIVLWLMDEGYNPLCKKLAPDRHRFIIDSDRLVVADGATMFEACEEAVNAYLAL